MFDLNAFAPQGDPFGMGMLFSQAAQNPEQMIPLLTAAGIEPPQGQIFNPRASPFSDASQMEFSSQNKPKGIPGIDTPADYGATPSFVSPPQTYPDTSAWGDPTGGGAGNAFPVPQPAAPVAPAAPSAPRSVTPAPASNPIDASSGWLKRLLTGEQSAAPSPEQAGQGIGDVFAAPTPPAPGAAPAPQQAPTSPYYPDKFEGPLPKPRDLAVIGKLEGGNYGQVVDAGKGRRALGAFGIMEENVGPWSKEVFGKAMTPEEFLANPEAQDRIAAAKFGGYREKYGSGEAATRAWLAGEGGMNDSSRRDVFGTNPFSHAANYTRYAANLGPSKGAQGIGGATEISASSRGQEASETAPAAAAKKATTLADALKGVSAPEVPKPLVSNPSSPSIGRPTAVDMTNPIGALLAQMLSGQKNPVNLLRLNQAMVNR